MLCRKNKTKDIQCPWELERKPDGGGGGEAFLDRLYKEMALSRDWNDVKEGATHYVEE